MWRDTKFLWLLAAAFLVTVFEILSLTGIRIATPWAFPLFLAISVGIGYETLWHGIKALSLGKIQSINLLMTLAVAGAFWLGEYEEAAVVIVLFTLAERLEYIGVKESKSSIDSLVRQMPKTAWVEGEKVPLSEVKIGQKIRIKPYEMIPLDGVVLTGASFVDESTITGEPLAVDKSQGEKVFAATRNMQGTLEVEVTADAAHSTIATIREMTFSAMENKAKTHRFIQTFSTYYTPMILLLALVWVIWTYSIQSAITLLVISCPCALVISTPIAIYAAIGRASKMGVLIKGGRYLEVFGQVRAIAFDKTRTLTWGEPIVTDVIPFNGYEMGDVLACAAGVELFSEHPLGQSIVQEAEKLGLSPHEVEEFESHVGKGARGDCMVCTNKRHTIGKLEFILEEHEPPQEILETIERLQKEGKTVVVVSSSHEIEGVIALQDALRQETPEVIKQLKELKIASALLTGDNGITGGAIGKKCGIETVRSELLPQDKVAEVKALKHTYQTVAMVGDGVNDAPALAAADVGVSMTELGSDTALEAANVVILRDHLRNIPRLVRLGRRTLRMIRFNTALAIGTKFAVIVFALMGEANLALAIFADVGITLLVICNSLRLMN